MRIPMIRLNKFLADRGLASRRKCDHLIQSGKIKVNGEVITQLGFRVDEAKDEVAFENKPVSYEEKKIYVLLNKPMGYVTTVDDERGRKTVMDLIPVRERVFPIGRLDKDTEGLLLLTNDGDLCHKLTHPRFSVEKVYQATIDKTVKESDRRRLEHGIMLDTGMTAPCKIRFRSKGTVEVMLHEGKKRQVRKMFQTLGYDVLHLVRIRFASITLANLNVGQWRHLTAKELNSLKQLTLTQNNQILVTEDA